jgi:hypothetical protein
MDVTPQQSLSMADFLGRRMSVAGDGLEPFSLL